jgi:hypothetical protein
MFSQQTAVSQTSTSSSSVQRIAKRFLSVPPAGLKNRAAFASWFWLRSPAAKAVRLTSQLYFGLLSLKTHNFW